MEKKKRIGQRRQFLKNTSLAVLSMSVLPKLSTAKEASPLQLDCDPTTIDYYGEGPFYTPNAPSIVGEQLASQSEPGVRLTITGRVRTIDCEQFIPETLIDVWHADDNGNYDNVGFNLRGQTYSNSQGFYSFETIYPGKYLNGGAFRPAHIHFHITPPGYPMLTTQLYFEGDPDNDTDAASSITNGTYNATNRIIELTEDSNGNLEGTWDIVINGDGVTGLDDLHLNNGMIYKVSPNPFSDYVEIQYGVFREAAVSLLVYDIHGRLISILEETTLQAEKYMAVWRPDIGLVEGHYFIALKVNDLQVHYLKVLHIK